MDSWRKCVLVAALAGATAAGQAQTELFDARTALEQWVQARQLTAKTRSDWQAEKETIEAAIRMFETELADLETKLAGLGGGSERLAEEQRQLETESQSWAAAADRARELIAGLERQMASLAQWFPGPLMGRVRESLARFPEDPAHTRMTPVERAQNLVAILNEVEKFGASITVESEIRQSASGLEVQVETLYLGLARAYSVGQGDGFAAVSAPGAEGWIAADRPELASAVRKAIAVYRNQQPATFVGLPIEIVK